jgi:hypothetical protein
MTRGGLKRRLGALEIIDDKLRDRAPDCNCTERGLSGFTPTSADLYQLLKAVRSQAVNYVTDVGTVNNLAVAFNPALDGYTNGLIVRVKVAHTNTGSAQIDCGPGARPIVNIDGSGLAPGELWAAGVATLCYVDTEFQLLSPNIIAMLAALPPGGGGGVTGGVTGGTTYNTYVYNAFQGIASWTSPGTYNWTVPGGVQHVWGRLWAGGGPGAVQPNTMFLTIGGHGGYAEGRFDVIPGTLMQIVIGAGAFPPLPSPPPPLNPPPNPQPPQFSDPGVSAAWGNTYGGNSSFSVAGGAVLCSATGGRGCYVNPGQEVPPTPGEPGVGTGGTNNRANGLYGRGGGLSVAPAAGPYAPWFHQERGGDGALILMY